MDWNGVGRVLVGSGCMRYGSTCPRALHSQQPTKLARSMCMACKHDAITGRSQEDGLSQDMSMVVVVWGVNGSGTRTWKGQNIYLAKHRRQPQQASPNVSLACGGGSITLVHAWEAETGS